MYESVPVIVLKTGSTLQLWLVALSSDPAREKDIERLFRKVLMDALHTVMNISATANIFSTFFFCTSTYHSSSLTASSKKGQWNWPEKNLEPNRSVELDEMA